MDQIYTFNKDERLCLKKRIDELFNTGKAITLYPLKLIWLPCHEVNPYPVQVLFTVSSRRFKNAVDRNRIKRKIREIYRIQKSVLYNRLAKNNITMLLGIIYIGNDPNPQNALLKNKLSMGIEMLANDDQML
jgi:ribonuclease P protein component